jgi:hypothetical protein
MLEFFVFFSSFYFVVKPRRNKKIIHLLFDEEIA